MISVIIPTLNEAMYIGSTLAWLAGLPDDFEIIVVDGGSIDSTKEICSRFSAVCYIQMANAQRARQMNRGAGEATGDILLFLHADTLPPDNFIRLVNEAMSAKEVIGGAFSIEFDNDHWLLTIISRLTRLNLPWLTFGDHGIFLRKADFLGMNGFAEMPILEDLELQLRLHKRGLLIRPKASMRTSARRFVNQGVIRQTILDLAILAGYFICVSPDMLARYYSDTVGRAR